MPSSYNLLKDKYIDKIVFESTFEFITTEL